MSKDDIHNSRQKQKKTPPFLGASFIALRSLDFALRAPLGMTLRQRDRSG